MKDSEQANSNKTSVLEYIFNRYVLLVLIVFLVIGLPATQLFSNSVAILFIEAFEQSVVAFAETDYEETIGNAPINEPVSGKQRERIDSFVDKLQTKVEVQEVNIWTPNGTLVYSSIAGEPIGKKRAIKGDFAEALTNQTVSEIERRADPEVKGGGERLEVLEVYIPIHGQSGEIVNVFEIYAPLDPINRLIAQARYLMAGLFIVLFFVVAAMGQIGAIILSRKDQRLTEQKMAERARRHKDRDIRKAYSEVIGAVTNGKLIILSEEEMEAALGEKCGDTYLLSSYAALADARKFLRSTLRDCGLEEDRIGSMITGSGEAFANGIKHAGECEVQVYACDGIVQIRVSDNGPGINFNNLPKATLMLGFSTKSSLGVGFSIILDIFDRVLLSTSSEGTTLLLDSGGKNEADGFGDRELDAQAQ